VIKKLDLDGQQRVNLLCLVYPTLQLVPMLEEFFEAWRNSDAEIHGCSGINKCETVEQYVMRRPWLTRGNHQFFAVEPGLDKIVGCLRLTSVLNEGLCKTHGYNLGYSVHPKLWNRGYGTKLLKEAYEIAGSLGMTEVWLGADNPASKRAILKSGASYVCTEGVDDIFCYTVNGGEVPSVLPQLLLGV